MMRYLPYTSSIHCTFNICFGSRCYEPNPKLKELNIVNNVKAATSPRKLGILTS
jgi:hypothetical protein